MSNRLLNRFTLSLRTDIWNTYKRLPLATFEKEKPGNWKMRLIDDADGLGSFIKDQVVDYLFSLVTVAVTLVLTLRMSPLMTLLCCLTIPLVFLLNAWIGRGTGKVNEDIRGSAKTTPPLRTTRCNTGRKSKYRMPRTPLSAVTGHTASAWRSWDTAGSGTGCTRRYSTISRQTT